MRNAWSSSASTLRTRCYDSSDHWDTNDKSDDDSRCGKEKYKKVRQGIFWKKEDDDGISTNIYSTDRAFKL